MANHRIAIASRSCVALCLRSERVFFGQARDTASVFGTVTDAQAAVVPGAHVTVTNIATGLSRTAATDASGGFVFPLLAGGLLLA